MKNYDEFAEKLFDELTIEDMAGQLMCIQMNRTVSEGSDIEFPTEEFFPPLKNKALFTDGSGAGCGS